MAKHEEGQQQAQLSKLEKTNGHGSQSQIKPTPPFRTIDQSITYHLRYSLGVSQNEARPKDIYTAAALSVRERVVDKLLESQERFQQVGVKKVHYLSLEFLVGRSLLNNLYNLELYDDYQKAVKKYGVTLSELDEIEPDAALGNGGLGRLAACFMDSMATLSLPGFGYGINYEFGLFRQKLDNGFQLEMPDNWQRAKSPWTIERPERAMLVPVYGAILHEVDRYGDYNPMWLDWQLVIGVPHDMPIVGYGGDTVTYLRLYTARSSSEFDIQIFNEGDYLKAVDQKILSETITKVLYPSDNIAAGKELRLIQEYFLVACSLRDIVQKHEQNGFSIYEFSKYNAIQLNDTHPALAIPELMRILIDEYELPWEKAWKLTNETFGYTNHTLLPEALEKWPESLVKKVLPRHLQIIFEINHRFLTQVRLKWPGKDDKVRQMSLIEEDAEKKIRMANLAIVGSHSVNGVAAMHSELVKTNLVPNFYHYFPEKFNNKTNGITQRRWLLKSNSKLASLITEAIGDDWITDLRHLKKLEPLVKDNSFTKKFNQIKQENKEQLAKIIEQDARIVVDPKSMFDVHVKRIHEYKRQILNVMHIVHQYFSIVDDGVTLPWPKTYIFAGKAAPGYMMAKLMIKLINDVASVINNDKRVKNQIKVAFIPDYRVSLAENIIPATDLSEQISTAGKEASGTSNMKFILNGAITIGTLDGANIEIKKEVGDDNIFIFGLTAEQVFEKLNKNAYKPWDIYNQNKALKRVMDSINTGYFNKVEPHIFKPFFEKLVYNPDEYMHLADFSYYCEAQQHAGALYKNAVAWNEKAILNVARSGFFSSDRTIHQYAEEIWGVKPV